ECRERLKRTNFAQRRSRQLASIPLPPDRRPLKACFEARAACNMSSRRRPEFLQLCAFIAMVITPIQLNFDSFDFVLLWQRHSVVYIGRDLSARPGERDCCEEIEAALLQLGRATILMQVQINTGGRFTVQTGRLIDTRSASR